jgi:hypothetical protein
MEGASARMGIVTLLECLARLSAQRLGHDVGPLRPGRMGEHIAVCARCGGLIILAAPPRKPEIRGTACGVHCRSRRRMRPIRLESAASSGE